jgi:hypothetical protein
MKVDSHNIEFGYELLSALPYAYELHLKGELEETRSGVDTEPLYYFSKNHVINPEKRSWFNTQKAREDGLPYTFIHNTEQPKRVFPPYAEHFKNKKYKFKKPTLCICNRYNVEWSYKPINYFDEEILDWMFYNLKDKYEIVYFPVSIPEELQDNFHSMELKDIEVAKKHNVKIFTELREGKSWNETMLKVFANCEHFITMNGGYSIMASLFHGTNIIYSKPGKPEAKEIKAGSFWHWYPNLNNVRTLHVESYDDLKDKIIDLYIEGKPCLNILIRASRPNYLNHCIDSILSQTYKNINIVLICDSDINMQKLNKFNARIVKVKKKREEPEDKPQNTTKIKEYGGWFPYNLYIDEVQRLVDGYILVLDDDDKLENPESAKIIMDNVQKDKLLIWRANFNERGIKPSHSFGKEIFSGDMPGIAMCYHSDHVDQTDWSEWKRADYRTAKKLSSKLEVKW